MEKRLLILIGFLVLIFSVSSFVSAGYCLGSFECGNYFTNSDDCLGFYDWGCYWEGDETGFCSGGGSCSAFDGTSESNCEYYNGCRWQPGCLDIDDCNSGEYCTGTQYCTGTHLIKVSWVDPDAVSNPVSGVTRHVTPYGPTEWITGWEAYPQCVWTSGSPGIWACGPCTSCGEARANNVAYVVEDLGDGNGLRWYRRDCVWTKFLGGCINPRWAEGRADVGPAWIAGGFPCNSFYVSECSSNTGCSVYTRYGTCEVSCPPETDAAFCTRLEKTCGSVTANDNCGTLRTVNCGTCTAPQTCINNVCSCTLETDTEFCTRLEKTCGSVTANDKCGTSRTVASCGTCTLPETCINNVCTCPPETNSAFCTRLEKTCGSVTANDNCGTSRTVASCGTCPTGSCVNNQCVLPPEPVVFWAENTVIEKPITTTEQALLSISIPYPVKMVITNSGLPQGSASFEVFEYDLLFDDNIRTSTSAITGNVDASGKAVATWTITQADIDNSASDDGDEDYEFYFKVNNNNNLKSGKLYVQISIGFCEGKRFCSDYITSADCDADICGGAENYGTARGSCAVQGSCDPCYCTWDSLTIPNVCKFASVTCNSDCPSEPTADDVCSGLSIDIYDPNGDVCRTVVGTADCSGITCPTGPSNSTICKGKFSLVKNSIDKICKIVWGTKNCGIVSPGGGICYKHYTTTDDCDDGMLTSTWTAEWVWDENCDAACKEQNADNEAKCVDGSITTECPAQIQLPFFGIHSLIIAAAVIILVYLILNSKKKHRKKK